MTTLATISTTDTGAVLVQPETPEARKWLQENVLATGTWVEGSLLVDQIDLADILLALRDGVAPLAEGGRGA